jgi:hypothetical protein
MAKDSNSSTSSTWTGMVPVDDTAPAVTDPCGSGIPAVYLNGQFATQGWRHITYDERARGSCPPQPPPRGDGGPVGRPQGALGRHWSTTWNSIR